VYVRDDGGAVPVGGELLAGGSATLAVPVPVIAVGGVLDVVGPHPVASTGPALGRDTANGADAAKVNLDPLARLAMVGDETTIVMAAVEPRVTCKYRHTRARRQHKINRIRNIKLVFDLSSSPEPNVSRVIDCGIIIVISFFNCLDVSV
jgi:hypothetical protein